MDGYGIRAVAQKVGCSYQTVSNYLRKLETSGRYTIKDIAPYHEFTPAEVQLFCETVPRTDGSIEAVSKVSGIPEERVETAMDYVTTKKLLPIEDSVYPAIADWMRRRNVTVKTLALNTGISQLRIRAILGGTYHMTLDQAKSIKRYTGLTLKTIFGDTFSDELEPRGVREDRPDPMKDRLVAMQTKLERTEYRKPPKKRPSRKDAEGNA